MGQHAHQSLLTGRFTCSITHGYIVLFALALPTLRAPLAELTLPTNLRAELHFLLFGTTHAYDFDRSVTKENNQAQSSWST